MNGPVCSPIRLHMMGIAWFALAGFFSPASAQESPLFAGIPDSTDDRSVVAFSDLGAWHGFSLPPSDRPDLIGGFVGPLLFDENLWLATSLVRLRLSIDGRLADLAKATSVRLEAPPGLLIQSFSIENLDVRLILFYGNSSRAVIRCTISNATKTPHSLRFGWTGSMPAGRAEIVSVSSGVRTVTPGGDDLTISAENVTPRLKGAAYVLAASSDRRMEPSESVTAWATVSLGPITEKTPPDIETEYRMNRERWNRYLRAIDTGFGKGDPQQILAEKALMTLIINWRSPRGGLHYDGLFPSSAIWYFNGFWAWDSWKHAVAIARFDPELAKQQMRAMYDYQNAAGMIPDVIYTDTAENNWRDTKPPLSGWAIREIFKRDGDRVFVEEMYPKLVRYHRWWYQERDHDRDGLCEYGSTDGTLIAAKWESGMDNAVRFDMTGMLRNGDSAWSMDQESVDLNAYLYKEKTSLAVLAEALDRHDDAIRWRMEAEELGEKIRREMFDERRGWFSDISIDGRQFIQAQGPEGWIPLWAGVATPEQAASVRGAMLDPQKFYTYVPFPTVSRSDPGFSDGYWRGLVWVDQAWFAIEGLGRYGYHEDSRSAAKRLLAHLEGAIVPGFPLFENYHAMTGEGRNVRHFSWTAAHLLLLVLDGTLE